MTDTKTQLNSIQEAYMGVITEGKEAKFKVGDKVGIGSSASHGDWDAHDTGTVSKVNSNGQHTVEFDNRKSGDDSTKPYTETFDHIGRTKKQHGFLSIIPKDLHNRFVKEQTDRNTRTKDIGSISHLLDGHKNGFGHYSKLSKEHADHIKSLLDKHTEE